MIKKYILKSAIVSTIALSLFANSATAVDLRSYPKLKAGEWQMTIKPENLPAGMPAGLMENMTMLHCIDEATQEKLISQAEDNSNCETPKISQKGNTFITDVTCKNGNIKMESHVETTFVSDSEITNHVTMRSTGQPTMKMSSTAKYIGACKDGRKPGDMAMVQNGNTISLGNAEELMKMGKDLSNNRR